MSGLPAGYDAWRTSGPDDGPEPDGECIGCGEGSWIEGEGFQDDAGEFWCTPECHNGHWMVGA